MDKLAVLIERCSGILLGAVAIITVAEVLLRRFFAVQVPDAYTLAGYLQGIAIFWGIATAVLAGRHIVMDLVWSVASHRGRLLIDLFATLLTGVALGVLAWMMMVKVASSYDSGETTFELVMPVWPMILLAAAGAVGAALMSLVRARRILQFHAHESAITQPGGVANE